MTQAAELVALATLNCPDVTYWQAEGTLEPYATVRTVTGDGWGGVRQVERHWPLYSREFRHWLRGLYLANNNGAVPNGASVKDAIETVAAGVQRCEILPAYVRVAGDGTGVTIDLGDDSGDAVRVDGRGWAVVEQPGLKFRRRTGFQALPRPERGGRLEELRSYINLADDGDWYLLTAWLVSALRPRGPYPVLLVRGQQGTAKSTACRVLRQLVDPNASSLRSEPKEARDLMIAAKNSWVIALDNLSSLPSWLSDSLSRLSTGGGFAVRALYSDDEEAIFDATRPVLLNGIEDFVNRPDLVDRLVTLELEEIPATQRRAEHEFWRAFERARPRLFGAVLDALAGCFREQGDVRLGELPRMADFAITGAAVERALRWDEGAFINAYTANRDQGSWAVVEDWPLFPYLETIANRPVDGVPGFRGTVGELLKKIEAEALVGWSGTDRERVLAQLQRRRAWPTTPKGLGNQLNRLAPDLARNGIRVDFPRRLRKGREVIVTTSPTAPASSGEVTRVHDEVPRVHGRVLRVHDGCQYESGGGAGGDGSPGTF